MYRSLLDSVRTRLSRHRYGFTFLAFVTASIIAGVVCVGFIKGFEHVLEFRLDFERIGNWAWVVTPSLFLISAYVVQRFAPAGNGAGIPEVVFASTHLSPETESRLQGISSLRTLLLKVFGLYLALWAGASTGPEAPAVQITACAFVFVLLVLRKFTRVNVDLRSAVIAGGAAGLAAAFNAPLAGVTFAIEELSVDYFASIKDYVLMSIVFAAIAAKSLTGEYTYFGHLMDPQSIPVAAVILIGIGGGIIGALFATGILHARKTLMKIVPSPLYVLPIASGLLLLVMVKIFGTDMLGPGNVAATRYLHGHFSPEALHLPLTKIAATIVTAISGVVGGVFAPCLAAGAAVGADIAHFGGFSIGSCALVGMAACLAGTIQAPITTFVIIFEMTGHHQMLVPVMLGSLIAHMTSRLLGADHLYHALSHNYEFLLGEGAHTEAKH